MTNESKALSKTDSENVPEPNPNSLLDSPRLLTGPPADHGTVRVLVYGSLKQDCGNHCLMERIGAKWLGYDSITGEFSMMSFGGFPGVVRRTWEPKQVTTIFGELYSVDEEGLAALDMLESHPNWYERIKFRTDVLDRRAWMYTLPHGEGYLDENNYAGVPEAIWHPTADELQFWGGQGVEIASP